MGKKGQVNNPEGINQYSRGGRFTSAESILRRREQTRKLKGLSAMALHAGRSQELRSIKTSLAWIDRAIARPKGK